MSSPSPRSAARRSAEPRHPARIAKNLRSHPDIRLLTTLNIPASQHLSQKARTAIIDFASAPPKSSSLSR